jgi:gliding motility-associated-like protein
MRFFIIKCFLFLTFSIVCANLFAQIVSDTCKGSLGDPVIKEDFGSGSNPGPALPSTVTDMMYAGANLCPNDGYYTIVNNVNPDRSCHPTWQVVPQDHTGNPNGYMMLVNASYQPSVFFTQSASGLCQSTVYEFSAYVLNLITLAASGPDVSEPDITFTVETTSGQVLASYDTGTIPPTAGPTWNKYGLYFTTPAGITDVVVKMTNNAPGGNGNDLVLDDIAFRACGPVIENGFNSSINNTDQNLCQGSNATFNLQASVSAGYINPLVQWQTNTNGGAWTDIPGATDTAYTVSFTNAVTGIYQYRIAAASAQNITSVNCRTYSGPLTINVNALPVVPPIANTAVCESDTLTLTASGGAAYLWSGPGIANTTQNPLVVPNITPANAGVYQVIVTSAQGCVAAPVQTTVKVEQKVVASASGDATICAGESTQLSASSIGGLHYKWTPAAGLNNDTLQNPVATPAQTTTYTVNVSNDGCYDDSKSVTVTVLSNPVANAGPNKVIFEGQSMQLNGTSAGDNIVRVYWTPADYLSDPTSLTPIATPPHDTTYTLNVVSGSCGTATSSVFVRVYQQITIPNTFSPNNDGINDYWNIDALVTYPECEVLVFNRYGQQVYKSIGYNKPWDGTSNGSALPAGAYYYIIDLKNGTRKLADWVLIVR